MPQKSDFVQKTNIGANLSRSPCSLTRSAAPLCTSLRACHLLLLAGTLWQGSVADVCSLLGGLPAPAPPILHHPAVTFLDSVVACQRSPKQEETADLTRIAVLLVVCVRAFWSTPCSSLRDTHQTRFAQSSLTHGLATVPCIVRVAIEQSGKAKSCADACC